MVRRLNLSFTHPVACSLNPPSTLSFTHPVARYSNLSLASTGAYGGGRDGRRWAWETELGVGD